MLVDSIFIVYIIFRYFVSWLIETILRNFDKIDRRVTDDIAAQKAKEEREKEARKERIQKLKALQNEVEETVAQICVESLNGRNQFKPLEEITVHIICAYLMREVKLLI